MLLELALVAQPQLWAQVAAHYTADAGASSSKGEKSGTGGSKKRQRRRKDKQEGAQSTSDKHAKAAVDAALRSLVSAAGHAAASDVRARTVSALVWLADREQVYVVNDDVAPHPQLQCLGVMADTALDTLESCARQAATPESGRLAQACCSTLWQCLDANHVLLEDRFGRLMRSLVAVVAHEGTL